MYLLYRGSKLYFENRSAIIKPIRKCINQLELNGWSGLNSYPYFGLGNFRSLFSFPPTKQNLEMILVKCRENGFDVKSSMQKWWVLATIYCCEQMMKHHEILFKSAPILIPLPGGTVAIVNYGNRSIAKWKLFFIVLIRYAIVCGRILFFVPATIFQKIQQCVKCAKLYYYFHYRGKLITPTHWLDFGNVSNQCKLLCTFRQQIKTLCVVDLNESIEPDLLHLLDTLQSNFVNLELVGFLVNSNKVDLVPKIQTLHDRIIRNASLRHFKQAGLMDMLKTQLPMDVLQNIIVPMATPLNYRSWRRTIESLINDDDADSDGTHFIVLNTRFSDWQRNQLNKFNEMAKKSNMLMMVLLMFVSTVDVEVDKFIDGEMDLWVKISKNKSVVVDFQAPTTNVDIENENKTLYYGLQRKTLFTKKLS